MCHRISVVPLKADELFQGYFGHPFHLSVPQNRVERPCLLRIGLGGYLLAYTLLHVDLSRANVYNISTDKIIILNEIC